MDSRLLWSHVLVPRVSIIEGFYCNVFSAAGVDRAAMPEPTSGVAKLWTGYPFGGGWAIQRAGYGLQDLVDDRRRPSILGPLTSAGPTFFKNRTVCPRLKII